MSTIADRLEQQLRERGAQKIGPPGHVGVAIDALDVRAAIAALRAHDEPIKITLDWEEIVRRASLVGI